MKKTEVFNGYFMEQTEKARRGLYMMRTWKYEGRDLFDVYECVSRAKRIAFERCEAMRAGLDGFNAGIVSHNCNIFTFGFEFARPDTGVLCFAWITPENVYFCEQ